MAEPVVNWITGVISVPKTYLTLVQSVPTEIYNLDLNAFRLSLRDLEDDVDGRPWPKTHSHNTEVLLSGLTYARVIEILDPYTITFEDGQYAVNLIGANSNVADKTNVNQVSIRPQNSAGLISSQAIEFGEYGEAITLDVINGFAGQVYPTGTRRRPSGNVLDMNNIAAFYGFNNIKILENTTFGVTNLIPDDIRGYHITGVSHINTYVTIEPEALCLKTSFSDCKVTGTLDGNSEIYNCVTEDLAFFYGHIHNSYLSGTITLAGLEDANIENCRILDFDNPPIIDAGGSGQNLMVADYTGIIIIRNLTGDSKIGIGLSAGQVIIESSCTAGTIQVSGNGSIQDDSGLDCYVVDTVVNGTDIQNLSQLIDLQNPHHTGTGNMWFWNPALGNDAWDGKHKSRGTKTFAQAHAYASDNNHDVIVCISGNLTGQTITTETLIVTKNYIFVRGPGRDFFVNNTLNDAVPAIDIQGNGVEISGMIVANNPANTSATIKSTGSFPLIKDIWIENSSNGILLDGASNGLVDNARIRHNTGYGIRVQGQTDHFSVFDTHIAGNSEDGVQIDLDAGFHELLLDKDTVIHNNDGYGITISANSDGVILGQDLSVFDNTLGPMQDLGTNSHFTQVVKDQRAANTVWETDLSVFAAGTAGNIVNHLNHLTYTIFLDTGAVLDGNGSQHNPFNSEASAVDTAEEHGILGLSLQADVDFTRQIKNFLITSTNIVTVDFGANDMSGSRFNHLTLTGSYLGAITAQDCSMQSTTLNGFFDNCALAGVFEVPDGGSALLQDSSSLGSVAPPTVSVGGVAGTAMVDARGHKGGLLVTNCNQPTDTVRIVLHGGTVIIDASCNNGVIRLAGFGTVINNSTVVDYDDQVSDPRKQSETHEMLGLLKGSPITLGNGRHLSANIDVLTTDNGNGTFTLERQ